MERRGRAERSWLPLLGAAAVVTAWAVASRLVDAAIILPTPLESARAFAAEVASGRFATDLLTTFLRAASGFLLSLLIGLCWGIVAGSSPRVEAALSPVLVIIRSTPVIALILLALIWFQTRAAVFVTVLMVLPVVVETMARGSREVSGELREMARVFGVPAGRQIRELVLPGLRPYLLLASHAGLGMAYKVTVAAEVIVQPPFGIGSQMQEARFYLDTPRVLALTLTVVLLAAATEGALRLMDRVISADRGVTGGLKDAGSAVGSRAETAEELRAEMARKVHADGLSSGWPGAGVPVGPRVPAPLIILRSVCVSYPGVCVLDSVSAEFRPGTIGVILGPSGCGKTTLLRVIAGLIAPDSGNVDLVGGGRPVADSLPAGNRPPTAIAFQEPRLLPWKSAAGNLRFVLPSGEHSGVGRWLQLMRLDGFEEARPGQLSGGMRQRLSLARALLRPCSIVLLDEPLQNLDLRVKIELAVLIRRTVRERGQTCVLVTHDVAEALVLADELLVMGSRPGRVVASQVVDLAEADRDPRALSHQRLAARVYEELLSGPRPAGG